jgi:hypothetical protein
MNKNWLTITLAAVVLGVIAVSALVLSANSGDDKSSAYEQGSRYGSRLAFNLAEDKYSDAWRCVEQGRWTGYRPHKARQFVIGCIEAVR